PHERCAQCLVRRAACGHRKQTQKHRGHRNKHRCDDDNHKQVHCSSPRTVFASAALNISTRCSSAVCREEACCGAHKWQLCSVQAKQVFAALRFASRPG